MSARTWVPLLALLAAAPAWAQVPAGPEFRLSDGDGIQRGLAPAVALQPDDGYVAVWSSFHQDGVTTDVFGRRFDRRGQPLGGEFRVNAYTTGTQRELAARPAVDARGNFVVVWRSDKHGGQDGAYHLFGQRFARDATPLGAEFAVDGLGPWSVEGGARVGSAPDGSFLVAWGQYPEPGGGVRARRYDPNGTPVGDAFTVNTTLGADRPDIAFRDDGSFIVAWEGARDGSDVLLQRFDASGARVGGELRLNANTPGYQGAPALAMARDGGFVAAWESDGQDGDSTGVFARRFDAAGAPLGAEIQVNTFTPSNEGSQSVAVDERGDFVVTWQQPNPGLTAVVVSGRRFSAAGVPRGAEFAVADNLPGLSGSANVVGDGVGNFLVAYFLDLGAFVDSPRGRRYQGLVPEALAVDAAGNAVLEPGESADVAPTWRNISTAAQSIGGAAPAFTGPAGATYTILDASAAYGTIADDALSPCTDCYRVSLSAPSTRPAAHWDATFEERLTPDAQGQDKLWSLHVGDSFTDVPRASGTYRFVETLFHRGVTGGCASALYCPTASTTREQMAVFLLAAKEGAGYAPVACGTPVFADVPAASPFCRWIEELARRAVTGGCGGGNYCPAQAVTREQMAVFVLRTLDPALTPPACGTPVFNDVPASSAFCRWIEEMARRGITGGCGGGNYCPAQAVTREQMAVFLTTAFALSIYGP